MKTLTLSECDRILKDKLVKNGTVKGNPTFMQDVGLFVPIAWNNCFFLYSFYSLLDMS